MFSLAFETDAPEREGKRQCVWIGFSASLNEQSNFRKFLRQWRGRDLTEAEKIEFSMESLIELPATLIVAHEIKKDGETFAKIAACLPYKGGDPLVPSGKFIRKMDRNKDTQNRSQGEGVTYRHAASADTEVPKGDAIDDTQAGADWQRVKVHVGNHAGVELLDLDEEAIKRLIEKWLPLHQKNPKPTADDNRLASALIKAKEYLEHVTKPKVQENQCDY